MRNQVKLKPKISQNDMICIHISIIILNVNGLNSLIKRHRLADWNKKEKSNNMLPVRDSSHRRDTHRLKVKGWEKTYHAHGHSKKAGVSILISDNVDFKPKLVRRDKEGHFRGFKMAA